MVVGAWVNAARDEDIVHHLTVVRWGKSGEISKHDWTYSILAAVVEYIVVKTHSRSRKAHDLSYIQKNVISKSIIRNIVSIMYVM